MKVSKQGYNLSRNAVKKDVLCASVVATTINRERCVAVAVLWGICRDLNVEAR